MEEKISVVLPTYNGEGTVKKSIESVLAQTYANWELILVNDCSTDGTQAVLEAYAAQDTRIRVVNNDTNQRLPRSLNIGFSYATGELLTWTSDDNAYRPIAFETLMKAMQDHAGTDMVYADFDVVDMSGNFLWHEAKKSPDVLRFCNTVGACFLYKRSLAQKIGGYDEQLFLAEDYEYWIRAYLNGNLLHITDTIYDYGWHDKSLTATRKAAITKATFLAKEKHMDALLKRCSNQSERNAFFREMLRYLNDPEEQQQKRRQYYAMDSAFARTDRIARAKRKLSCILHYPITVARRLKAKAAAK